MVKLRLSPALLLSFLTLALGCAGREGLCEKVCAKADQCEEGDEGYRDFNDCVDRCEETAEETEDACQQEFRRLSKCYKRRFDCDGSHGDACRSRRDLLNECLNAQDN